MKSVQKHLGHFLWSRDFVFFAWLKLSWTVWKWKELIMSNVSIVFSELYQNSLKMKKES